MRARFDVLVLGGGTAGCVLASRLSEEPDRSVCLVEAGPITGRTGPPSGPADMLDSRLPPDSHDWSDGERTLAAGPVVGGCSSHNACTILRGAPGDYASWGAGWSYDALLPCFERVECGWIRSASVPRTSARGRRPRPLPARTSASRCTRT